MRFFIDHGTIHDKQTGKHICCNDLNEFDIRETICFLNEQQAAYDSIVEDRNELHRFNLELDKALTESHAENDRLEKERDELIVKQKTTYDTAAYAIQTLESELAAAKSDVEYYSKQRNEFAAELELAKTKIENLVPGAGISHDLFDDVCCERDTAISQLGEARAEIDRLTRLLNGETVEMECKNPGYQATVKIDTTDPRDTLLDRCEKALKNLGEGWIIDSNDRAVAAEMLAELKAHREGK